MSYNIYKEFCTAIDKKEIKRVEKIFSYSDTRYNLISHCVKYCPENEIIDVFNSFTTSRLKDMALKTCEECSIKTCCIKGNTNLDNNIKYYFNKKYNFKNLK